MTGVSAGLPLTLRVYQQPSVTVVCAGGVLDFATVPLLRAVVAELLADRRAVVVDLAGVTLLDANSAGVLVTTHRQHRTFRVRGAVGRALRVLEIVGADKILDPADDPAGDGAADTGPETGDDWTVEWLLRARTHQPGDDAQRFGLRQLAIAHATPFATALARRYRGRGEPADDLAQVALVGLIKAVDGYDAERPNPFHAYAVPTIVGELKRHFRDKTWQLKVPRRLQEIRLELGPATDLLCQRLNRAPTVGELAAYLGAADEQVLEAMEAAHFYRTASLSAPVDDDGGELVDHLGAPDDRFDLVEDRESLRPLLAALPVRQQRIVAMRFYGNLTQSQIADAIGVSQMHVSRLLADALNRLRTGLQPDSP